MAVPIIQDFIPVGRRNRPGYSMVPLYITIHTTGNTAKGADAKAHANYWKGTGAAAIPASVHFTVDGGTIDGTKSPVIYQSLPLNENGWHASDGTNGKGNRRSIAIEICVNSDGNFNRAVKSTAWLCSKLIKEISSLMPFPGVMKQHFDWSGKDCPHELRIGNRWSNFITQIEGILKPSSKTELSVLREIKVYLDGKEQDEIGVLLSDNQTRISAKFAAKLFGGEVVGEGDRVLFTSSKENLTEEVETMRGKINVLEFKIRTAKEALS